MISRFVLAVGLGALMVVTGVGSYMYLQGHQSKVAVPPQKPTQAAPRPDVFFLPGTLYFEQAGALYSINAGRYHQITPEDGWTQPALSPDGNTVLAVKRSGFFSDVYALSRFGRIVAQITNNVAQGYCRSDVGSNQWSFYPRLSPDQHTLWMSYDGPKYVCLGFLDYNVNLSIWAVPFTAPINQGRSWTNPNDYTGGDIEPLPLSSGAVIYTKFSYDSDGNRVGQLWYTNRAGSAGHGLTTTGDDCMEPALSPDQHEIAMICTYGKQISHLGIASFDGSNIGPLQAVVTDQLVAQPVWAPDGSGIAYLAPSAPDGPFQLWFLPRLAYHPPVPSPIPTPLPTPGGPYTGVLPTPTPIPPPPPIVIKPIQMTTNLGLDATSPMTWAP
jgi:Tol biopolymer transport system component